MKLRKFLTKNFEIKDLGDVNFVLGIHIHWDCFRGIIRLSQKRYIEQILKRFDMQDCKLCDTSESK